MKIYILVIIVLSTLLFKGCYRVGHQDWINYKNSMIGSKLMHYKPYKYKNSGKIIRGNFLLSGQGFTNITKDKNNNLIYHYFSSEVLENFNGNEKWIGKCLYYYVIDPNNGVVLNWGFDKGGNPLSCRTWN